MHPELVPALLSLKLERGNESDLEGFRSDNWCVTNDGHFEDGVLGAAMARQSVSPSAPCRRAAAARLASVGSPAEAREIGKRKNRGGTGWWSELQLQRWFGEGWEKAMHVICWWTRPRAQIAVKGSCPAKLTC